MPLDPETNSLATPAGAAQPPAAEPRAAPPPAAQPPPAATPPAPSAGAAAAEPVLKPVPLMPHLWVPYTTRAAADSVRAKPPGTHVRRGKPVTETVPQSTHAPLAP